MLSLDKNKKYLLACSYGPDSMALLHMLLVEGYNFSVAHVNYHFRKESDMEASDLALYCRQYEIELFTLDNEEKVENNLEARARNIRYLYFKKIYDKYKFDALLVAHQLDDHIETYLMQKKRNSYVFNYGLAVFSNNFGMEIIRPLLSYSKADLINYCTKNNVPYAIDVSNFDTKYLRNDIRRNIVSRLSKEEKDNYLKIIKEENDRLDGILFSINLDKIKNVTYLKKLDKEHLMYAIFLLKEEVAHFDISLGRFNEISKVIHSEKSNVNMPIKENIYFVKSYNKCYFETVKNPDVSYLYKVDKPMVVDTPYFYFDFTKLDQAKSQRITSWSYPLTIRNAQRGRYNVKDYTVNVNRLFIDWKMPLSYRKVWPIIFDKIGRIVYIPRYQKDFKISDNPHFYVKNIY